MLHGKIVLSKPEVKKIGCMWSFLVLEEIKIYLSWNISIAYLSYSVKTTIIASIFILFKGWQWGKLQDLERQGQNVTARLQVGFYQTWTTFFQQMSSDQLLFIALCGRISSIDK